VILFSLDSRIGGRLTTLRDSNEAENEVSASEERAKFILEVRK